MVWYCTDCVVEAERVRENEVKGHESHSLPRGVLKDAP